MPIGWAAGAMAVGSVVSAAMAPDAPDAPDYSQTAAASVHAANMQAQTSREQLEWAKQQYAEQSPITNAYMQAMIDGSNQQADNARADRIRYEGQYQPIEDRFVAVARDWNSPNRANMAAGAALADVAVASEAARRNATMQLESYGVDPSQTRYQALDLGARIQQAGAMAAAGTQSRRNTEATSMALMGEAINTGKGYPAQVTQAYAGATNAGSAGIASALNTASTYGNLMGSPTAWAGASNNSLAAGVGAMNAQFQNQMQVAQYDNAQNTAMWKGVGGAVGMAAKMGYG